VSSRLFSIFLSFTVSLSTVAQVDTTLQLPLAEISAISLRHNETGEHRQIWSTESLQPYQGLNLPDLLSRESGIYIKSYGASSSATSSIRGGSAGQTAVSWNGFPIQSPMLGQLDFSLMPIGLIDQVQLQYGGRASSWGSGAVGGAIHLSNQPLSQNGFKTSYNTLLGSFGLSNHQVSAQYRNNNVAIGTRLLYNSADNNFPFRATPNTPEQRLDHAQGQSMGALQEIYWWGKKGGQLSLISWLQTTDRALPPTTVQSLSLATQNDAFARSVLQWKKVYKKQSLTARAGLFKEKLDYRDELIFLKSVSRFWTVLGEIESLWHLNQKNRLQLSLFHIFTQANTAAYASPPTQSRTALLSAYRYRHDIWELQFSMRAELADGQFIPITPSMGIEGQLTPWLRLSGRIDRSYRLPTLNDLYWQIGGNPDLKPEQGWSQEVGITIGNDIFSYRATVYNRNINDWILWSIRDGNSFWSANNISKVWSRGIEQRFNAQFTTKNLKTDGSLGYDYGRSTNEIALEKPSLEKGEQLIYTPEHRAFARVSTTYQHWTVTYQHWLSGAVNTINIGRMDGYNLGSFSIQYTRERPSFDGHLFFRIENIWNTSYRIIERRPMPGRHFQIGININYKQLNN
jgi:vitamin B12 transporter